MNNNQYKDWTGYTGIKPLKIDERGQLIFSDEPLSICPGTLPENLDEQQLHAVTEDTRDNPKFSVFCALSQQKVLQVFLFLLNAQ
jgi:hypothetical protein